MLSYGAIAVVVAAVTFVFLEYQAGKSGKNWCDTSENALEASLVGILWIVAIPLLVLRVIAWHAYSLGRKSRRNDGDK